MTIRHDFIDLVVTGPDFSGTSTQIDFLINYFMSLGNKVRDIRGTEIEALFHADIFKDINNDHISLKRFLADPVVQEVDKDYFRKIAQDLMMGIGYGNDLRVASMVENDITSFVNPIKTDVWINEEPTRRGAGQVNRVIEQNRSKFGSTINGKSAAMMHQGYRDDEFLRFRGPIRENGLINIRSRSEESAVYQIYDAISMSTGVDLDYYYDLPGHRLVFSRPPTHMFVVCGPVDWSKDEYLALRAKRTGGRILDDHELKIDYQLLVNRRYASNWLEEFYENGCGRYNARPPEIIRFDIYNSKEKIKEEMIHAIGEILKNYIRPEK